MTQANGTGTWSSQSDFAACTGKGISVKEDVVRLRRGVTFADEMGNCNQHDREAVSGLRQARKTFFIPEMGASRALLCPYLLCDRADGELAIDVNGHSLRVVWSRRPFILGRPMATAGVSRRLAQRRSE